MTNNPTHEVRNMAHNPTCEAIGIGIKDQDWDHGKWNITTLSKALHQRDAPMWMGMSNSFWENNYKSHFCAFLVISLKPRFFSFFSLSLDPSLPISHTREQLALSASLSPLYYVSCVTPLIDVWFVSSLVMCKLIKTLVRTLVSVLVRLVLMREVNESTKVWSPHPKIDRYLFNIHGSLITIYETLPRQRTKVWTPHPTRDKYLFNIHMILIAIYETLSRPWRGLNPGSLKYMSLMLRYKPPNQQLERIFCFIHNTPTKWLQLSKAIAKPKF